MDFGKILLWGAAAYVGYKLLLEPKEPEPAAQPRRRRQPPIQDSPSGPTVPEPRFTWAEPGDEPLQPQGEEAEQLSTESGTSIPPQSFLL